MPEPATAIITSIAGAFNTGVTVARFVYEVKNTPDDVKTCLDLVRLVDEDIQYAISLREKHLKHLSSTPARLKRLDRIIASANQSILDVGRLLEGCRREAHGGQVPMKGRMQWVMGDSTAFSRRTPNLQQQHAAINVEIAFLEQLEALQPIKEFVTSSTIFDNTELLSMERRKSSTKTPAFTEIDLIDLSPPPEYTPPVSSHTEDDLTPELIINPEQYFPEMPHREPSTPRGIQPRTEANDEATPVENIEDEDYEVAYYRELRQQEEERRQRLARANSR